MDVPIKFRVTTIDGEEHIQDVTIIVEDSGGVKQFIAQSLKAYASLGVVLESSLTNEIVLIPCNQIKKVLVEMPSIILASANDTSALDSHKGKLIV